MKAIELKIPPFPEYVSIARLCLAGIGARLSLPLETIEELKVALAEACTNAIQHAYPANKEEKFVKILFQPSEEELIIVVEDSGQGFDPEKAMKPPSPDQERGLGVYLIKALVSEVKIESQPGQGTKVTMCKKLHEEKEKKEG